MLIINFDFGGFRISEVHKKFPFFPTTSFETHFENKEMGFNDALTFPSLQLESPRMSPRSQSPRVKRRPRTESTGNKNKKKLAQCLKIKEKVSFNIASEASFIYILIGQKFILKEKNGGKCHCNIQMRQFG